MADLGSNPHSAPLQSFAFNVQFSRTFGSILSFVHGTHLNRSDGLGSKLASRLDVLSFSVVKRR
jgi:hypothetical protein